MGLGLATIGEIYVIIRTYSYRIRAKQFKGGNIGDRQGFDYLYFKE